ATRETPTPARRRTFCGCGSRRGGRRPCRPSATDRPRARSGGTGGWPWASFRPPAAGARLAGGVWPGRAPPRAPGPPATPGGGAVGGEARPAAGAAGGGGLAARFVVARGLQGAGQRWELWGVGGGGTIRGGGKKQTAPADLAIGGAACL